MKLLREILTEAVKYAGYWKVKQIDENTRRWIPVFEQPTSPDALFPFSLITNMQRTGRYLDHYQAWNILPGRQPSDLPPDQRKLLVGLYNALKQRSTTDKISVRDFQELEKRATVAVLTQTNLRKQSPQRLFLATPPTSSPVAEDFARSLQHTLKIPDDQTFYGHFQKRDVLDVWAEIEDKVPDGEAKEGIIKRIQEYYGNRDDTTIKIKDFISSHRKTLKDADIDFMEVIKDFDLKSQIVPYLIIVDDNYQRGATAKNVGRLFTKATGVRPGTIVSLSMFKYPG